MGTEEIVDAQIAERELCCWEGAGSLDTLQAHQAVPSLAENDIKVIHSPYQTYVSRNQADPRFSQDKSKDQWEPRKLPGENV